MKNNLWWNGPLWLNSGEETWPKGTQDETNPPEIKKSITALSTRKIVNENDELLNRFSSLSKLLRVTAYCFRFIKNCKIDKGQRIKTWLLVPELENALKFCIINSQSHEFSQEIADLLASRPISNKSRIQNLHPFCDNYGILRVGDRLTNSNLTFNEKHPAILSDKNNFTTLLINQTHRETLHGGTQITMAQLKRNYWIVNGRNTVRHLLHKCVICFRQKATTSSQLMGQLPTPRVNELKAFRHTGVDYCGPMDIKISKGRSNKTMKAYIAIFICLSVKAIHIEIVTDLTADAFMSAFRRFIARRGLPTNMYSDNGTTFVKANKDLSADLRSYLKQQQEVVSETIANQGITWSFNPPAAPHHGGLWERGVRSIKHHLKRIMGRATLTYEEMNTLVIQIVAFLNSRPLCPITNDPEDFAVLTPGHFLTGEALLAAPEPSILDVNEHRLTRWQRIQQLQQSFWKVWRNEYLTTLQIRPKWLKENDNVKEGMVVLLKDDRPPTLWQMAKIVKTYRNSKDDLIRVVDVRTKDNVLKRPITKICL